MARSRKPEPPPAEAELKEPPEAAAARIKDRIAKGLQLREINPQTVAEVESLDSDYKKWNSYNSELLKRLFTTEAYEEEYSWWGAMAMRGHPPSPQEKVAEVYEGINEKVHRLESILERLELIPLAPGVTRGARAAPREHTNKVFVVHGHDEAARESVARFLETIGIDAVILHEKATQGRTLVEKLEHYSNVDFAVVLLTPDDIGASKEEPKRLQPRARQNVVVELGYFLGKLGRKKVCALYRGPLELPSDFLGVVYVPLDAGGGWRLLLAKELRSSGFQIDMNAI